MMHTKGRRSFISKKIRISAVVVTMIMMLAMFTTASITAAAILIGPQRSEAAESNVTMLGESAKNNATSRNVETSSVQYYANTTGFLAKPSGNEGSKYPGIVMIHEWWGLNDNIKEMARQMASEGYEVLAVDLYHGNVTSDSAQAQALATSVKNDPQGALNNLKAAVSYLRGNGTGGSGSANNNNNNNNTNGKVGSLGWCFGGDWSMQLALNEKMDATALYYGKPVTDPKALSVVKWPVLGVFGSADQSISVDKVKAFKQTLDKDGIQNEIYIYDGVGHAFANPSGPNYAPNETKDAWQKTLAFFNAHLK